MSETIQAPESRKNRWTQIAVAVIAALATIIAAYLKLKPEPGPKTDQASMINPGERSRALTGRIVNAKTQRAVGNAKVSLEFAGAVPVLRYPDSEGIFDFATPSDASSVRIRVEAPGYRIYDRHLNVTKASGIEEIRLEPASDPPTFRTPTSDRFTGNAPPVFQTPSPKPAASILDESLPVISGADAPWAVVIFGGHQDRRDDVNSWVRDALSGSGHDTVSLFRKVADEQRVAPDLHRGKRELMAGLDAGRYCSRILVAKFTVVTIGTYEGLTTAEAKIAVHMMSPSGEMLKSFDISERGGGLNEESAQRAAIDNLKEIILRDLPSSI